MAMIDATFDVAVIGGGVVGCAILRALSTVEGLKCALFEKNKQICAGASGGNSGLLHTGFDAPPSSLEAQLMRSGYQSLCRLLEVTALPIQRTGALMVSWTNEEKSDLPDIVRKAHSNGVKDVREITVKELYEREPHLSRNATGAVFVPGEASVDPWLIPMLYLRQAQANGARVILDCEIVSGRLLSKELRWEIHSKKGEVFQSRAIINCGGLYGDIVEQINRKPTFTVIPRQGQYVVYNPPSHINSIILPLPTPRTKGIIVYKTVYNQLVVGPTAEDVSQRDKGQTDSETIQQLIGKGEQVIPLIKNLTPAATFAGLRPATQFPGYLIQPQADRKWITVAGIRSTGLTSSLAIAEHVLEHYLTKILKKNDYKIKSQQFMDEQAKRIASEIFRNSERIDWNNAIPHPLHKLHFKPRSKL